MHRKRNLAPKWLGLILGLIVLLAAGPVSAYYHFQPRPQGNVGVSRPPLAQKLVFGAGERLGGAEAWLDGIKVPLTWDASTGFLYYVPPTPLTVGTHHVEFVVQPKSTKPGWSFQPLRESYDFTVVPGALAQLPAPSAESRLALAYLNAARVAAGLPAFGLDPALSAAASAHAAYLAVDHFADAHVEQPDRIAFTGAQPGDRAGYFGYYETTGEVVAYEPGAERAISGWLASLYHRLSLVDPDNRLLGYAGASGERLANVLNCGPAWPLGGGGGTTAGVGSPGGASLARVCYPYPGQTGVPTSWAGRERPDPLRLYPGTQGPLGYTVTLGFPDAGDPVLSAATLTAASGGTVAVMVFDPAHDDCLAGTGTVALIPRQPLEPNTVYTARFVGSVGASAFDETWSFTTGPGTIEVGPSGQWSWSSQGDRVEVSLGGIWVRQDVTVFMGGLPVRELSVLSRTEFSFRVPAGFEGGVEPLTLTGRDGSELTLDSNNGFPAAPASAGDAWSAADPPFPFASQALRHCDGTVVVPASCLARLGATAETIPGLESRTNWSVGGHLGTVTVGSAWAYIDGRPVQLDLPVQALNGETYVPADFVSALALALSQFPDLAGHWAQDGVARLVTLGIVSGVGDGTFRPQANLTRAAFVKMLVLAIGLEPQPGATGDLADTADHWVSGQGYIGPAVTARLIRPDEYPGGIFEPNRNITREEIAVMVVRAMGLEDQALPAAGGGGAGGADVFTDLGRCRYPGHVAVAVAEDIVHGYQEANGTKTFRPTGLATRAEAAVMVNRLLDWLAAR